MLKTTTVIAVVLLLACAVGAAEASRAPTYIEKVAIMDVFNIPGRSFASRCVRIVVSTVDPRYAYVTSPIHISKACSQAGEVGNGLVVFHREPHRRPVARHLRGGRRPVHPAVAGPARLLRHHEVRRALTTAPQARY